MNKGVDAKEMGGHVSPIFLLGDEYLNPSPPLFLMLNEILLFHNVKT